MNWLIAREPVRISGLTTASKLGVVGRATVNRQVRVREASQAPPLIGTRTAEAVALPRKQLGPSWSGVQVLLVPS